MAAILSPLCASNSIYGPKNLHTIHRRFVQGGANILLNLHYKRSRTQFNHIHTQRKTPKFHVLAATKGSAKSSESEEKIPSWANPDSDEPPPWARDEGKPNESKEGSEAPFYVYLLASAITAIAAIGSIFEYANQNPVFGVLNSDSIFYAPVLGFFAFTGIPTSAFLWFKSVQAANKEAEEQDRRDGFR